MDKIWNENLAGHCGGDEKTEWPCRTENVQQKMKKINNIAF